MDRPSWHAAAWRLAPLLTTLALSGCAGYRSTLATVVITALPSEVQHCKQLKHVFAYSGDSTPEIAHDQMRRMALDAGGNAVFVRSYTISSDGVAYACDPPLDPADHPTRSVVTGVPDGPAWPPKRQTSGSDTTAGEVSAPR